MDFSAFLCSKMSTSTSLSKNWFLIGSPLCLCLRKLVLIATVSCRWRLSWSTCQFQTCLASPMLISFYSITFVSFVHILYDVVFLLNCPSLEYFDVVLQILCLLFVFVSHSPLMLWSSLSKWHFKSKSHCIKTCVWCEMFMSCILQNWFTLNVSCTFYYYL